MRKKQVWMVSFWPSLVFAKFADRTPDILLISLRSGSTLAQWWVSFSTTCQSKARNQHVSQVSRGGDVKTL